MTGPRKASVPEEGTITRGKFVGEWHPAKGTIRKLWVASIKRDGVIVATDPSRRIKSALVGEFESPEAALGWLEETLRTIAFVNRGAA